MAADIAVAVPVVAVMAAQAAQELLHSLTPRVAVVVAVATVQISAGIVTLATLDATAAADQLVHIIVQLMELVVAEALAFVLKVITVLAAVRLTGILQELADSLDLTEHADLQANHGLTVTAMVIIAVASMVAVVVAVAHHTEEVGAAKAPFELYGQQPELTLIHRVNF